MAQNVSTVEMVFKVNDQGSVVIDKVSQKVKGLGDETERASAKSRSALSSLKSHWLEFSAGAFAGYLAIKKIIDTMSYFVNAAAEEEKSISRMSFQIEQAGIRYDKIKDAVESFAASIQQTTRFSDEAAREGLGKMMIYTDNLSEALKNVKLAMDMATQTGMDFDSAIRLIGMAMEGDVERLGRYIPQMKHLKDVLGENASQGEKAEYAIRKLNELFAGAAVKDVQTYEGATKKLSNQFGEIAEAIGKKLLPVFQLWKTGAGFFLEQFIKDLNPAQEKQIINVEKIVEAETKKAQAEKRGYEETTKYATKEIELNTALKMLKMEATNTTVGEIEKQLWALGKLKEGWNKSAAATRDYINALRAVNENIKKLAGEDVTEKKLEAEIEYQEKIKGISADAEDRQKQVNRAIDEYFKKMKEIERLKIPTHADVGPMEREVNESVDKLSREQQIVIKTRVEESAGGGETFQDFTEQYGQGLEFPINFTGTGSTKKPISEKIREIIGDFGGLDKALQGMEAEINIAEYRMEYASLERKLAKINRVIPDLSNVISRAGGATIFGLDPYIMNTVIGLNRDLTEQMKILQMRMNYEALRAYGGSMQTGGIVPFTGLYTLHQGEKVTPKNVSVGGINITINGSRDAKTTADELVRVLKYKLSTELRGLI